MSDGFICRQTVEMTADNPMMIRRQPIIKGDKGALIWRVTVTRYGKPADLTGATADLYCARAADVQRDQDGGGEEAGGGTTYSEAEILEGGVVQAELPADAANVPGPVVCLLRIRRGEAVVGVARMAVDAVDLVGSDIVDEGNRILSLGALVEAAQRCEEAAQAAETAAAGVETAIRSADSAAAAAREAAEGAGGWADATATAHTLDAGADATVSLTTGAGGAKNLDLGIPRGNPGRTPQITFEVATGEPGTQATATVSGTAEAPHILLTIPRGETGAIEGLDFYTLAPKGLGTASPGTSSLAARGDHIHPMPSAAQVGARPDTWMPSAEDVGARPAAEAVASSVSVTLTAAGWTYDTDLGPFVQTVQAAGVLAADSPIVDMDASGATAETFAALLGAWSCIDRIETADGQITATCYRQKPEADVTVRMLIVR